jgi:hypothetical protein
MRKCFRLNESLGFTEHMVGQNVVFAFVLLHNVGLLAEIFHSLPTTTDLGLSTDIRTPPAPSFETSRL